MRSTELDAPLRFPGRAATFEDAAAAFERLQQPHHLAAAQLLHGQLLAAAGQKDKGLQAIAKAKAKFAELGLKRLEKEAKHLLERGNKDAKTVIIPG